MTISKEAFRAKYAGCAPPSTYAGKIAEWLRRMAEYRDAKTILIMPSALLFQARINCLLDGKTLFMPSPAIKLGFYRVKPFSIAFPDLAYGTSLKGITLFGKKVKGKQLQGMDIDLAMTGYTENCFPWTPKRLPLLPVNQKLHHLGVGFHVVCFLQSVDK